MRWLRVAAARLRGLLRGDAVDRDIDEELRCHIEMLAEENMRRGMTEREAHSQALRSFGNMGRIKDAARQVKGGGMLEVLWQDLRYGARMLLKRPGFTLVAITALALGIGANTAIFSVVNAILLRSLPFAHPERVVAVYGASVDQPDARGELSYPDFVDYKNRSKTLEHVAGYIRSGAVLGTAEEPVRVMGADVSAELFPLLGVQPLLGRVFTQEEDKLGSNAVIVLSYEFWQSHFGGDPSIVGQPIKLGGNRTVLGVMPPGFKFPMGSDYSVQYWSPLASDYIARFEARRESVFLPVIASLKPGVTIEQAQSELSSIASSLAAEYPSTNANRRIRAVSLHEDLVRDVKPALLILFGAVGFVLLIACANVANLLLAQASGRGKEIAIRTALGASRARIVRQLLVESLLLSLIGAVIGLLLAYWGLDLLVAISPEDLPRLHQIALDKTVLVFTLAVAVLTGVVFGLTPALQASKVSLSEVMKEGARGSSSGNARTPLRLALVVGEVALSLVLVVGAGLLARSFMHIMSTDLGFDPNGVLVLDLPLSTAKFPKPEQQAAFFQELVERTSRVPGVAASGVTTLVPLGSNDIVFSFNIEGRPPLDEANALSARSQVISASYFETMRMSLKRGRALTEQDAASAPQVLVVNEAFARLYFPDEDPIGKRVIPFDKEMAAREIVGVVGDVRQLGADQEHVAIAYIPHLQQPVARMRLLARSASGSAADITQAVRGAIRELNSNQLIWQTQTLDELLQRSVAARRFNMILLAVFALVALVLAATGIFGVMSFTVAQRTHEIGIRIALGAQQSDVLRLVIGQGLRLTLVGIAIGLSAAFALTRLMNSLLYGVSATDPATFAALALLLFAVALMACYIPARRAMKVDPILALRYE